MRGNRTVVKLTRWARAPALALLILAATRAVKRVEVEGPSMSPALEPGDRLLLVLLRPRLGDVVAVPYPRSGKTVVKRVASIGPGTLVLAGDNPAESTDSRQFGPVPVRRLVPVAVYRYAPADRSGRLSRS